MLGVGAWFEDGVSGQSQDFVSPSVIDQLPNHLHDIAARLERGSGKFYKTVLKHQQLIRRRKEDEAKGEFWIKPSLGYRRLSIRLAFQEANRELLSSLNNSVAEFHKLENRPDLREGQNPEYASITCVDFAT